MIDRRRLSHLVLTLVAGDRWSHVPAYLDVLGSEPPPEGHPLITLPNCWVTPHIAWASVEARIRLLEVTVDNVRAFLAGAPCNVVS